MPSYAEYLLLFAGLVAAAPAWGHHSKHPGHSHTSSSSSSVSQSAVPTIRHTTSRPRPTQPTSVLAAATSLSTSYIPQSSVVVSTTATTVKPIAATNVASAGNLWQPTAGTSWQIVLNNELDMATALSPNVAVFDIDMFINDASTIQQLKAQGKHVICYFSAGSYEPYRDDADQFLPSDLGNVMDGWPDEKWIDTKSANVRKIMTNRILLAKSKGCDAIDPDNVDGYSNSNIGVTLTEDDGYDYMQFLAQTAAANGMSTGLKNANALVSRVQNFIQFSVNEQCHRYNECGDFQPFIANNKPVFNIEYPVDTPSTVPVSIRTQDCSSSSAGNAAGFSTVLKTLDLDGWVSFCDASTAQTAIQ